MANDVYYPVEIADTPLPQTQADVATDITQSAASSPSTPTVIPDQPFPTRPIAHETIGSALNTKSRKILAEFQFTQMGAIQIGQLQNGVSGDVRISPGGIVARDEAGNVTFALDGDTGNAVFAGEVQAGAFISGEVIVGDGNVIIDGDTSSINIFDTNKKNLIRLDDSGLIGFDTSGVEIMHLKTSALELYGDSGDIFRLLDAAGGTLYGKMGYFTSATFDKGITLYTRGGLDLQAFDESTDFVTWKARLLLGYNSPNYEDVFLGSLHGDITISAGGNINLLPSGAFKVNGTTKTAIVDTSDGYKALYCAESPEVWFFDFASDKETIDPLFLEATEGKMKTLKTEEGELLIFRRRKGYGDTRFEGKTLEEFDRNNDFWQQAH